MPTIEVYADPAAPVSPDATCAEVFARFDAEPLALVLAVVADGAPLGIVERDPFLRKLAAENGRSLYGARPISLLMDMEPVVVEGSTETDGLIRMLTSQPTANVLRGFIVARQGRYLGVGTLLALMQRQPQAVPAPMRLAASGAPADGAIDPKVRLRFARLVARELRTPMKGVAAVADLLKRQPLDPDAQAYVQTIVESADTSLRLLDDAMDLITAQAGELTLKPNVLSLGDFMDGLQSYWSARATQDGVRLMVGYQGDTELAVEIDETRLRQVFDRLIGTALRGARKTMVEASLRAFSDGDVVRIQARVFDSGQMMDADRVADIFNVSESEGGRAQPLGLSLPACRLIVEAMGGTILAESNAGRGVTFTISLEAPRVAAAAGPTGPSNLAALPDANLSAQPHILIVDDNATNRVVTQALCEMFGCTSAQAVDGLEALEAVQSARFDLILMDIKMPRMDGVQATAAIRALPGQEARTPIVALTANADPEDARSYVAMGMVAVVEKPIKPERLMQAMNQALGAGSGEATAARRRSADRAA